LNKVAGIYGLIAVLTGAGGSFAQLSLYIYSALALVGLVWGLNAVKAVRLRNPRLYFPSDALTHTIGRPKTNTVFRTPVFRRPYSFHDLDRVLRGQLVDIYAPRWSAAGQLASAAGDDGGQCQAGTHVDG
jgi:hypothetical protein